MMQQASGWAGSRRLLRLLRDLMKRGGGLRGKLDQIARLIAQDLVAEVCSIYVMRAGEVLELFATQGLNPEAVHRTRLRSGEGLVGHIALTARPIRLAEAQKHPKFAYRPETGEEVYHSLMGVPILRDGRVLGVLVIQNVTARTYTDEEEEALETVAMVLAEMIYGGDLLGAEEARLVDAAAFSPVRLPGIVLNEGLGVGRVVLHQRGIVIGQVVAESPEEELERLRAALAEMRSTIEDLMQGSDLGDDGEHSDILETFRMFAEDRGWLNRITEAVNSGLTAEAAVQKVQNDTRARMAKAKDSYIQERLADLDELANRLMQHLLGAKGAAQAEDLPEEIVVLARSLGPAELLDYDRRRLRGVILEDGSLTAHVVIVARALGIPVVGRCRGVLAQARPLDEVLVDGESGQILLRPAEAVRDAFLETMRLRARKRAAIAADRDLPPVTRDGQRIDLMINAGLLLDIPQVRACGADGVGLYRTEVPFMVRRAFPDVEAQTRLYGRVLAQAEGKPVVFRTLDVGGDKALPYWDGRAGGEENPAMGWRALRIGLDRPAILRQQLRALIRAGAGQELRVMFPMVSEVAEFEAARALLEMELARAEEGKAELPARLRVGAMLEVPALAWQLPALFARVDFLALGSNDLFQFLFASDRGNPRLARRYDPLSPAALTFVSQVARAAGLAGVPLSVCGEMAGNPLEAMALLGCGVRRLSMAPGNFPAVRSMVRSLDLAALEAMIAGLLDRPDRSLRERLRGYALDHGIAI